MTINPQSLDTNDSRTNDQGASDGALGRLTSPAAGNDRLSRFTGVNLNEDFSPRHSDLTHKCPTCGLAVSATQDSCPVDGTAIAEHSPGYVLDGKYEFIELIGSGGMGVIYKARHIILNKAVAVKMLHSHMISDKALMRFQREGKAGSALSHPNISAVLDFTISQFGQPYMVMEFETGLTLAQMLEVRGTMDQAFVIDAMMQACEGLAHAHERKVLHRDLKPSNMMVIQRKDSQPLIKLLDFGIAKILDVEGQKAKTLTRTGEVVGSPPYMSPEQASNLDVDRRSDLYSLGCVMFECLTGAPPFVGENVFTILIAHANDAPPTLQEATLGKTFPAALERTVAKLLQKNPNDRYQTVEDLYEDLQRFKSGKIGPRASSSTGKDAASAKTSNAKWLAIASAGVVTIVAASVLCFTTIIPSMQKRDAKTLDTTSSTITKSASESDSADIRSTAATATQTENVDTKAADKLMNNALTEGERAIEELIKENGSDVLKLGNYQLKDSDLKALAKCTSCQQLNLQKNQLDGTGLVNLSAMKSLNMLRLDHNHIGDVSFKPLSNLTKLSILDLSHNPEFTGKSFHDLPETTKFNALSLDATGITDDGIEALRKFKIVFALNLAHTKISTKAAKTLSQLKETDALDLTDSGITNQSLKELCKKEGPLFSLCLGGNRINDDSVKDLRNLLYLQQLDVSGTDITAKGIKELAELPHLEKLWCGSCGASGIIASLSVTKPKLVITEEPRKVDGSEEIQKEEADVELPR